MSECIKSLIFCAACVSVCAVVCGIVFLLAPSPFVPTVVHEEESVVVQTTSMPRLNINTATVEELMELGVFDQTVAVNIVAYRETYGNFTMLEDILAVDGVTQDMYNKAAGYMVCRA